MAEDLPDLNDPELNAAATKIQAVQKGRMAREEVAAMKKGTASGEAAAPEAADAAPETAAAPADSAAPAEELPDLNDPELNAAATKIQAVQKGRVARAEVATMKNTSEGSTPAAATESHKEAETEAQPPQEANGSSADVEAAPAKAGKDAGMGSDTPMVPEADEAELNAAATKIQAVQKGRKARAEVASLRAIHEESATMDTADDLPKDDRALDDDKLSLTSGMTPAEVAEMFFKAVERRDYDIWLQTLHMEARSHPSARAPGPFWCQEWELLREWVRKQSVKYKLQSQREARDGSISLKYVPLYGDVPGYTQGERMTKKLLCLDFEKEINEWRVMYVTQIDK